VFVALNPQVLPVRAGSDAERFARVRNAEQLATLGADVVVELNTEGRCRQTARVSAITRRAERAQTIARQREHRSEQRHADRAGRADRGRRPHHPRAQREREVLPDGR
jgi:hypothetical protein